MATGIHHKALIHSNLPMICQQHSHQINLHDQIIQHTTCKLYKKVMSLWLGNISTQTTATYTDKTGS